MEECMNHPEPQTRQRVAQAVGQIGGANWWGVGAEVSANSSQ
ncbi:hypothetical protein [Geitlerinema sp. P-1104]